MSHENESHGAATDTGRISSEDYTNLMDCDLSLDYSTGTASPTLPLIPLLEDEAEITSGRTANDRAIPRRERRTLLPRPEPFDPSIDTITKSRMTPFLPSRDFPTSSLVLDGQRSSPIGFYSRHCQNYGADYSRGYCRVRPPDPEEPYSPIAKRQQQQGRLVLFDSSSLYCGRQSTTFGGGNFQYKSESCKLFPAKVTDGLTNHLPPKRNPYPTVRYGENFQSQCHNFFRPIRPSEDEHDEYASAAGEDDDDDDDGNDNDQDELMFHLSEDEEGEEEERQSLSLSLSSSLEAAACGTTKTSTRVEYEASAAPLAEDERFAALDDDEPPPPKHCSPPSVDDTTRAFRPLHLLSRNSMIPIEPTPRRPVPTSKRVMWEPTTLMAAAHARHVPRSMTLGCSKEREIGAFRSPKDTTY